MRVTVYTKPACHLCEDVLAILDRLTPQYGLEVDEVNILDDMALYDAYHLKIPVVQIEGGRLGTLEAPIDEASLRMAFEIARRGVDHRDRGSGVGDQGHGTWDMGRRRSLVSGPSREPLLD